MSGSIKIPPANAATDNKRYRVTFLAKDPAGNETDANGETIIVHGCDEPPVIVAVSLTPAKLPAAGGAVNFTATVTSCVAKPAVLVQVLDSGGTQRAQVRLTRGAGNSYSGKARLPANRKKKVASYAAIITATDSVGKDGPKPIGVIKVARRR